MQKATSAARHSSYPEYAEIPSLVENHGTVTCDWPSLRTQLLAQWGRLTGRELDMAGRNRYKIAMLVQRKYGVSARLVENYLLNLERTLPALSS